jgi:hypothetical protein
MKSDLKQLAKDYLKRKIKDALRRSVRFKTPMDMVILSLKAQQMLPAPITALDVFGRHGLLLTMDYADMCDYLELWEISPFYAKYAKKFIPKAAVKVGDSINAVREGLLSRKDYNFIVIDNWHGMLGSRYCEHFDLFPSIFNYIDKKAVIVINVIYDVRLLRPNSPDEPSFDDWMTRRNGFYGPGDVEKIAVDRLMNIYREKFEQWQIDVRKIFFTPQWGGFGFLVAEVRKH